MTGLPPRFKSIEATQEVKQRKAEPSRGGRLHKKQKACALVLRVLGASSMLGYGSPERWVSGGYSLVSNVATARGLRGRYPCT